MVVGVEKISLNGYLGIRGEYRWLARTYYVIEIKDARFRRLTK